MQKYELHFNNLNVSIFKKKSNVWLYIYNVHVFYIYKLNLIRKINIINGNCMELDNLPIYKNIIKALNSNTKQITLLCYKKIKFAGKGYKIKKNSKKSLIFLFNRAHLTIVWWKNFMVKKLKKYKLYLSCTKSNVINVNKILRIRYVNVFTKKGLRMSRGIIFKKKGKK